MKRRRSKRAPSSQINSPQSDTSVSPRTESGKPRRNDSIKSSRRGTSQAQGSSADSVSVNSSQMETSAAEYRREKMMKQLEAMKAHFEAVQERKKSKNVELQKKKEDAKGEQNNRCVCKPKPVNISVSETNQTVTGTGTTTPHKIDTVVTVPTELKPIDATVIEPKQMDINVTEPDQNHSDVTIQIETSVPDTKQIDSSDCTPQQNDSVVAHKNEADVQELTQLDTVITKAVKNNPVVTQEKETDVKQPKQIDNIVTKAIKNDPVVTHEKESVVQELTHTATVVTKHIGEYSVVTKPIGEDSVVTKAIENDPVVTHEKEADVKEHTHTATVVIKPIGNDSVFTHMNEPVILEPTQFDIVFTKPSKPKPKLNQKDFPFPVKGVIHRRRRPADILINSSSENIAIQGPDPLEIEKVKKEFEACREQIRQANAVKVDQKQMMEKADGGLVGDISERKISARMVDNDVVEKNVDSDIVENIPHVSDHHRVDKPKDTVIGSKCLDVEEVITEEKNGKSVAPMVQIFTEAVGDDHQIVKETICYSAMPKNDIITEDVGGGDPHIVDGHINKSVASKSENDSETAGGDTLNVEQRISTNVVPKDETDVEDRNIVEKYKIVSGVDEPEIEKEYTSNSVVSEDDIVSDSIAVGDAQFVEEVVRKSVESHHEIVSETVHMSKNVHVSSDNDTEYAYSDLQVVEEQINECDVPVGDFVSETSICDDKMATCCVTNFLSVLEWVRLTGVGQSPTTIPTPNAKLDNSSCRDDRRSEVSNKNCEKLVDANIAMVQKEKYDNRRQVLKPTKQKLKKEMELVVLKDEFEKAQNKARRRKGGSVAFDIVYDKQDSCKHGFEFDPKKAAICETADDDDDDDTLTTDTQFDLNGERVVESTSSRTNEDPVLPNINNKSGRRLSKRPVGQRYANIKTKLYTGKNTAPSCDSARNMKSNEMYRLPSIDNQNNLRQNKIHSKKKSSRPVGDRYKNIKTKISTGRGNQEKKKGPMNENTSMYKTVRNNGIVNKHQPMRERDDVAYRKDRDINIKYATSKIDTGLGRRERSREADGRYENGNFSRRDIGERYMHQPMRERDNVAYRNDRDINNKYATSKIDTGLGRRERSRETDGRYEKGNGSRRDIGERYMHQPMRERDDVAYRNDRDINNKYATSRIDTGLGRRDRSREADGRYENRNGSRRDIGDRFMHQPMRERDDVTYKNDRDINNKYATSRIDPGLGRRDRSREADGRYENGNGSRKDIGDRFMHQPMRDRDDVTYKNDRDINNMYATSNVDTGIGRRERSREADMKGRYENGNGSRRDISDRYMHQPMRERDNMAHRNDRVTFDKHVKEMVLADLVMKMNMRAAMARRELKRRNEEDDRKLQLMLEKYKIRLRNGEKDIDDVDKSAGDNDSKCEADDQQSKYKMFVPSPPPGQPSRMQTWRAFNCSKPPTDGKPDYIDRMIKFVKEAEDAKRRKHMNVNGLEKNEMERNVIDKEQGAMKNVKVNDIGTEKYATDRNLKDKEFETKQNVNVNETDKNGLSETRNGEINDAGIYDERTEENIEAVQPPEALWCTFSPSPPPVDKPSTGTRKRRILKPGFLSNKTKRPEIAEQTIKSNAGHKNRPKNDDYCDTLRNSKEEENTDFSTTPEIKKNDVKGVSFSPSPPENKPPNMSKDRRTPPKSGCMLNANSRHNSTENSIESKEGNKSSHKDGTNNGDKQNNDAKQKKADALWISFSPTPPPTGNKPQNMPRNRRPPPKPGCMLNTNTGHDNTEPSRESKKENKSPPKGGTSNGDKQKKDDKQKKIEKQKEDDVEKQEDEQKKGGALWISFSPTPPAQGNKPPNMPRRRRPPPKPGCMLNTNTGHDNTEPSRESKKRNKSPLKVGTSNDNTQEKIEKQKKDDIEKQEDEQKKGDALWISFSPTPPAQGNKPPNMPRRRRPPPKPGCMLNTYTGHDNTKDSTEQKVAKKLQSKDGTSNGDKQKKDGKQKNGEALWISFSPTPPNSPSQGDNRMNGTQGAKNSGQRA
ncbi:hypothetical protein ACF0H5_016382 [Mactra antiquata]